ncbi:flagellar export protein FliJ [Pseudoalteromonas luteoviolacea]|uniref:Flagellar FliJ protein n=2 Tax=Pseudoalteromonas luteoviolacea TaxID=43657 RepID=A0A162CLS3_9GAMM|nr:flagellar export protein FliJ [Pseudoalteromonas luteoviolacea]KZN39479.1 flagellar protein [Pseudoalteromonas luteoviolacea S2607]KZN70533.1 flagellar protein [Pseudoalteromonas luteoviolacea S4060-1]MBQ4810435.1 flagellar export protein FliJ [Pseudoalteromonas luteoviolacea]OCQ23928.1 flagellar export protein FliJ [Pseudoalteromonas luteoviolacea]
MAETKLALLHKLESDKEDGLRVNFVQAERSLHDNQQKLKGLNDFRLEYSQQLHNKALQGLSSSGFSQYHSFINKIEEAIKQQANTVATAKRVVEQRRKLWLAQQAKVKAIAKLIEKKELEKQKRLAKAEQKMLDEFATNIFMRRKLAN